MMLQSFKKGVKIASVMRMKKCEFCGKEISYHEMYCSDECQHHANTFYELRDKTQKGFSAINGVFVMAIGVCIFLYSIVPSFGVVGGAVSMLILGFMYYFLPFPPDVMIKKYQLKKSIMITRIIAIVLMALGTLLLGLHLFKVI